MFWFQFLFFGFGERFGSIFGFSGVMAQVSFIEVVGYGLAWGHVYAILVTFAFVCI